MHLYLIRHGEADYTPCKERGFIGQGLDLAPLTPKGITQIQETSKDSRLPQAELILTSPYNRAMHSAHILSKALNIDLAIELDLHEWMPDQTFHLREFPEFERLLRDFQQNKGIHPDGDTPRWESIAHLRKRVTSVLDRYVGHHERIIIVCHGHVIRSLAYRPTVENGEIIEMDYQQGMSFPKWEFS